MTAAKKAEVIRVNTAITEHKKVEKMVKSVISSESNVSKEGKAVITSFMSSVRGIHNLLGEKLDEPIMINGKQTRQIRDNETRFSKHASKDQFNKYICQYCSKGFDSSADLADHVLTHPKDTPSKSNSGLSAQSPKEYECPKCFSKYSSQINLKRHTDECKDDKKSRGSYKKKFSCEYCNKQTTTLANLATHIEHAHKNMKTPETSMVARPPGNSTKSPEVLKVAKTPGKSIKKHENSKVEKTPNSSKKSEVSKVAKTSNNSSKKKKTVNSQLNENEQPLFTPEKTISCDLCSEKFYNNGALVKHKEHCH